MSNDEVLKGIQMLKKNKAVGVDHISGEMIISSTQVLLPVYQKLFNSILIGAYYPELWKKGIVVNLFKTGDPYDTDNYRGLTINSCLGKVFNNIINNRLNKFVAYDLVVMSLSIEDLQNQIDNLNKYCTEWGPRD